VCGAGLAMTRYNGALYHADRFLRNVRLEELPSGSVLCAPWSDSRALWYGKLVATPRPDVTIIGTDVVEVWHEVARSSSSRRPVFFLEGHAPPQGFMDHPWGLFRRILPGRVPGG